MKVFIGILSIFPGMLASRLFISATMAINGYSKSDNVPAHERIMSFGVMISVALLVFAIIELSVNFGKVMPYLIRLTKKEK